MSVSVLLPVYNGEKFLVEAIESVLRQTLLDFEFIIIDDGSTDNTPEIIKEYCKRDSRVKAHTTAHISLPKALNLGISLCKESYIARMDADDVCEPERLQRQKGFLDLNPGISVDGSSVRVFGGKRIPRVWRYPLENEDIALALLIMNPLAHPAVMFRKRDIIKAGGYDETFPYEQDLHLWIRLRGIGFNLANIEDVLLNYRLSSTQLSTTYGGYLTDDSWARRIHESFRPITLSNEEYDTVKYVAMMYLDGQVRRFDEKILKFIDVFEKYCLETGVALTHKSVRRFRENYFLKCIKSFGFTIIINYYHIFEVKRFENLIRIFYALLIYSGRRSVHEFSKYRKRSLR